MAQSVLFAPPPKAPRPIVHAITRKPAAPFGKPDKRGTLWWERFASDIKELKQDQQAVLLEMLLEWPAERMDAVRLLLDRWCRAQPMERDNFMEAFGK